MPESPWVMRWPLIILAMGAITLGYMGEHFFMTREPGYVPSWVLQAPIIAGFIGIMLAFFLYMRGNYIVFALSRQFKYIYLFLLNKWFFDKLYNRVFVQGSLSLGSFFYNKIDLGIIDRFIPGGAAWVALRTSMILRTFQTGYLYHYAFVMLIGLVILIGFIILRIGQ